MAWPSIYTKQRVEIARLFCRLTNMDHDRLNRKVFIWSSSCTFLGRSKSWEMLTTLFFESSGTEYFNEPYISNVKTKLQAFKQLLISADHTTWMHNLWDDSKAPMNGNKLRTYRLHKTHAVEPEG
ncbi:unnamed protein product [Owenia fusiformis]|uniref:Uncharacterized protein n=1 Tax=Owenia fusiformis TaxID=6347 RepID=A0A8S4Q914_OWEFU|nr:unnamed protein product [Owenia fusiformis]